MPTKGRVNITASLNPTEDIKLIEWIEDIDASNTSRSQAIKDALRVGLSLAPVDERAPAPNDDKVAELEQENEYLYKALGSVPNVVRDVMAEMTAQLDTIQQRLDDMQAENARLMEQNEILHEQNYELHDRVQLLESRKPGATTSPQGERHDPHAPRVLEHTNEELQGKEAEEAMAAMLKDGDNW